MNSTDVGRFAVPSQVPSHSHIYNMLHAIPGFLYPERRQGHVLVGETFFHSSRSWQSINRCAAVMRWAWFILLCRAVTILVKAGGEGVAPTSLALPGPSWPGEHARSMSAAPLVSTVAENYVTASRAHRIGSGDVLSHDISPRISPSLGSAPAERPRLRRDQTRTMKEECGTPRFLCSEGPIAPCWTAAEAQFWGCVNKTIVESPGAPFSGLYVILACIYVACPLFISFPSC